MYNIKDYIIIIVIYRIHRQDSEHKSLSDDNFLKLDIEIYPKTYKLIYDQYHLY